MNWHTVREIEKPIMTITLPDCNLIPGYPALLKLKGIHTQGTYVVTLISENSFTIESK